MRSSVTWCCLCLILEENERTRPHREVIILVRDRGRSQNTILLRMNMKNWTNTEKLNIKLKDIIALLTSFVKVIYKEREYREVIPKSWKKNDDRQLKTNYGGMQTILATKADN